jgi:hypothetical protein
MAAGISRSTIFVKTVVRMEVLRFGDAAPPA